MGIEEKNRLNDIGECEGKAKEMGVYGSKQVRKGNRGGVEKDRNDAIKRHIVKNSN